MLAITQFEVHAYQKGRWSIHARYRSHEREDAIRDAQATQSVIGCPTKVVRETYYPESNSTETITVYKSPKAKALQVKMALARKAPVNTKKEAHTKTSQPKTAPTPRVRLSAHNVFFRVIIAAAISVGTTTLIVGVLAWMLSRFAEVGVSMGSDLTNAVLTYGYIVIFLFSFGSLFRSRLPLHRLLADLWTTAQEEKSAESNQQRVGPSPKLSLKPKHDPASSPEYLREWNEMKLRRGDLDALGSPNAEGVESDMEAKVSPAPAPAGTAPEKIAQISGQDGAKDDEIPTDAAPNATTNTMSEELSSPATTKEEHIDKSAETVEEESPNTESAEEVRDLGRKVLLRFNKDLIEPAISAMPDDPVTRRGAALILAGAAKALTKTSSQEPSDDRALLRDLANEENTAPFLTITFLDQYAEHISSVENTPVIEAGRDSMSKYLAGDSQLASPMATILSEWRTPFSSSPGAPAQGEELKKPSAPSLDIYLLTEVRHLQRAALDAAEETLIEAARDATMGTHNAITRASVQAHGGNEITHTGKGIFAQFETPDAALLAAADIQKQFKTGGEATISIAVIGNSDPDADPNFSPALSRHAQDVVAKAAGGEILCERRVRREAMGSQSVEEQSFENNQSEDPDMVDPLIAIAPETIPTATFDSARVS